MDLQRRLDSSCLGRVLEASRKRHLQAWLDSSLLHAHDHHNRRTGTPWPIKLWCPVGTCHRPGGCKGRSSSCPANDPAVARPACLQRCQPGLAQPAPNHRVSSAQLMTMLPATQGTALLQKKQQLTTEPAGPDSN